MPASFDELLGHIASHRVEPEVPEMLGKIEVDVDDYGGDKRTERPYSTASAPFSSRVAMLEGIRCKGSEG